MEDFTILQGVLFIMESLSVLICLFTISNILFLNKIRNTQGSSLGVLIGNVVAAMLPAPVFLLIEQILIMSEKVDFSSASHFLFSGTMLLLYFPLFWFVVKKSYSLNDSYLIPAAISFFLFVVNMFTLIMVKDMAGNYDLGIMLSSVMGLLLIVALFFNLYMLRDCFNKSSCFRKNTCDLGGGIVSLVVPYPFLLLFVFALTFILPEKTLGHLSVISVARIFAVMVNIALLHRIREVILSRRNFLDSTQETGDLVDGSEVCKELIGGHTVKYDDEEELFRRLMDFFEPEKPYLNPKLTINELAVILYTNKTYLSALINRRFKMNFSQFLNHYRVKEAQRVFLENPTLSLKALCEMSGFGSMASFNIAFRLFSGNTPAEWCREQKIKMRNSGFQGDVAT